MQDLLDHLALMENQGLMELQAPKVNLDQWVQGEEMVFQDLMASQELMESEEYQDMQENEGEWVQLELLALKDLLDP
jgi:hypothetical protein